MKRQVLIGAVLGIVLAVGLAWSLTARGPHPGDTPQAEVPLAPADPVPAAPPSHTLRSGPAVRVAPPRLPENLALDGHPAAQHP